VFVAGACRSPPPPAQASSATPPATSQASAERAPASASPAVALMEDIARDIEALGATHPQLAGFRAAEHLHRDQLVISYEFHTHPPRGRGGWTAAVPNPDADGIWLYVDLHDPQSTAQIHTQPVVPTIHVLGQTLFMLLLEGESTRPASGDLHAILESRAREAAASDACGHPSDGETPPTHVVAMDDILAKKPRSGRFTTEGWAQIARHCPLCPPGALCKPCEEVVWLSPMFGAFKDPLERDQNLVLAVPDARRFAVVRHYRVVFVACDRSSDPAAPLSAELRGLQEIP
jgi:hypothetical protein